MAAPERRRSGLSFPEAGLLSGFQEKSRKGDVSGWQGAWMRAKASASGWILSAGGGKRDSGKLSLNCRCLPFPGSHHRRKDICHLSHPACPDTRIYGNLPGKGQDQRMPKIPGLSAASSKFFLQNQKLHEKQMFQKICSVSERHRLNQETSGPGAW